MAIDFGALPPEITSAQIYAGPGTASMMAAASAWNGLAAELTSAALGLDEAITGLSSEEWLGPASASMAAAVTPYLEWTRTTAAQAERAATQATAAAAAFEAALASVVPPPLIAANRAQLSELLSTNVFGQNTNAIAALEAQYGEMWAQDAAAMYSYAARSATASTVQPFAAAPQIANPAASAAQSAAVAAATSTSVGLSQETLNGLISQIVSQLQTLASPLLTPVANELYYFASSKGPLSWLWQYLWGTTSFPQNLESLLSDYSPYASFFYYSAGLPNFGFGISNFLTQTAKTLGVIGAAAPAAAAALPKAPSLGGALGVGGQVAAGLGHAAHVGHLAVPSSWSGASAAPAARPAVQWISEPITSPEAGAGNVVGGMPVTGGGASRGFGAGPRYGFKPTVMSRPAFGG